MKCCQCNKPIRFWQRGYRLDIRAVVHHKCMESYYWNGKFVSIKEIANQSNQNG